jgi:cell division protein FtsB
MTIVSDGHKTTAVRRPTGAVKTRAHGGVDASRFSEFTRPIAKDKQLVKGRGKRIAFAGVAVVIAAALIASLFVLPVKSWMQQRDDMARKQNELDQLSKANAQLATDVNRLQTPDGIKEAARQDVGYGVPGEKRVTVLPLPAAPLALPAGWPYDAITQIAAVRTSPPAAASTNP